MNNNLDIKKLKAQKFKNVFYLYLKKLFGIKNIFMFVMLFLLLLIIRNILIDVLTLGTSFPEDDIDSTTILVSTVFISVIISYSYVFLKKSNFDDYEHNSLINFSIVFIIYSFLYAILALVVFINNPDIYANSVSSPQTDRLIFIRKLFFLTMLLTFSELLFISFINFSNDYRFYYIWVFVIFMINIIFIFVNLIADPIDPSRRWVTYHIESLLISFSVMTLIFIFLNFQKRLVWIHKK